MPRMLPTNRLAALLLRLGKGWSEFLIVGVSVATSLLLTVASFGVADVSDVVRRYAITIAVSVPLLVASPVSMALMGLLRQLEHARSEAHQLANTDLLTGLYNRRRWIEVAEAELRKSGRLHSPLALLMLDVDHFKHVNDVHGHGAGDDVLRAVADVCRAALRPVDSVARWGGEEFVVLLPGKTRDEGVRVAEQLRMLVAGTAVRSGGCPVPATVSIGVAGMREDAVGSDLDRFLHFADAAMYAAKQAGRNRVEVSPPEGSES